MLDILKKRRKQSKTTKGSDAGCWLAFTLLNKNLRDKKKKKKKAGIFQIHCRIKGKHEIMLKENYASIHILENINIQ